MYLDVDLVSNTFKKSFLTPEASFLQGDHARTFISNNPGITVAEFSRRVGYPFDVPTDDVEDEDVVTTEVIIMQHLSRPLAMSMGVDVVDGSPIPALWLKGFLAG